VAGADEETPGGFLCVNDDDDDNNGVADKDDPGPTIGEDDLVPITVTADGRLDGTLTLSAVSGASAFKLYENPDRSMPVTLPQSWPLLGLQKTFTVTYYVEGIAPSATTRDVGLSLTFAGAGGPCDDTVKLTVIDFKLKALSFSSDHGLMLDNNTDFEPTGTAFAEPEWLPGSTPPRNYPISHTKATNVQVSLLVFVNPLDTPTLNYTVTGVGSAAGFNFATTAPLPGGPTFLNLTSTDRIDDKIQEIDATIQWNTTMGGCTYLDENTGPHKVYVTAGTPRDTTVSAHIVTQKRMERAVQQASAANSLNPHEIVKTVIQAQRFQYNVPRMNAWTVPDGNSDCQTIVRFAEKVAKMVDLPGTFLHRNIYAIETAPSVAIEAPAPGGLGNPFRSHPTEPGWVLSLVAGGGCNKFEATAKFATCGQTRFYAPGTANSFAGKDDVLTVFDSLSWVTLNADGTCTVQEVIHTYPAQTANPPIPPCP